MSRPYRTLFTGSLVQESFLSVGGTDDPWTTVDAPFCLDGEGRPTIRGSGIAGAMIADLARCNAGKVPGEISGAEGGRHPSAWRTFNSHPEDFDKPVFRQHVAIDPVTGTGADGGLFNIETLPPGTCWTFLLEVDTHAYPLAADLARLVLAHWRAGRCLLGREVARGMGWMRLDNLQEYTLTHEHAELWPNAFQAADYSDYLRLTFPGMSPEVKEVKPAEDPMPGRLELQGRVLAGKRDDGYGIDSLSIGGHASDKLMTIWDERFLSPPGVEKQASQVFDPDFAVVTLAGEQDKRMPYIPGSSLRGPLRHALARLSRARGETSQALVERLFGTTRASAKLLIRDAFVPKGSQVKFAWLQHHAEDEFTAGPFHSSKFDRIAVFEGDFEWKMVLEDPDDETRQAMRELFELAEAGQIGLGGGQWRGHGWLHWEMDSASKKHLEAAHEQAG
ncbi:MAG: hypothetical protein HZB71_11320 [Betaproteobacteria bacterium]|nr:hypothetical protein [Betaproteobacteria bacterium]